MMVRRFVLSLLLALPAACGDDPPPRDPEPECVDGKVGCFCTVLGACDAGLVCRDDTCVDPAQLDESQCYTPCLASIAGDDARTCDADGLIPGCLDDFQCNAGACSPPGDAGTLCTSDADCPDFQTCDEDVCRSECTSDDDCFDNRGCFRRVCRLKCDDTSVACETGFACTGGVNGAYCMPTPTPTAESFTKVEQTFSITPQYLDLSFLADATFVITNTGPSSDTLTIRKLRAQSRDNGITTTERETPMGWLEMGTDGTARVPSIEVEIAPGGSATISLAEPSSAQFPDWTGVLEVSSAAAGTRYVNLSYRRSLGGRWTGDYQRLWDFDDRGLDAWLSGGRDPDEADTVANALVRRFATFRQGSLSLSDLRGMLQAIRSEAWDWDGVKTDCETLTGSEDARCYGVDTATSGLAQFVRDVGATPIPRPGVASPITIEFTPDFNNDILSGRVISAVSPAFPGDPGFTLEFADALDSCDQTAEECAAFADELSAEVVVGGRYVSDTDVCDRILGQTLVGDSWTAHEWREVDALIKECRSHDVPFAGDDAATQARNLDVSAANPRPNGRPMVRNFELIDGALISSRHLLVIVRETLTAQPADPIVTYGYLWLERGDDQQTDGADGVSAQEPTLAKELRADNCSREFVGTVLGGAPRDVPTDATTINRLVHHLINGIDTDLATPIDGSDVHYLCDATGRIDGGTPNASQERQPCPADSAVRFFTVDPDQVTQSVLDNLTCQRPQDSAGQCKAWLYDNLNASLGIILDPPWRCQDGSARCDGDGDPRVGKLFYVKNATDAVPLRAAIDRTFDYRRRLGVSRAVNGVYAPGVCPGGTDPEPYCYDRAQVAHTIQRHDCALELYANHFANLPDEAKTTLSDYLGDAVTADGAADGLWGAGSLVPQFSNTLANEARIAAQAAIVDDPTATGSVTIANVEVDLPKPDELQRRVAAVQIYRHALERAVWNADLWRKALGQGVVTATSEPWMQTFLLAAGHSQAIQELSELLHGAGHADLADRILRREQLRGYLEYTIFAAAIDAIASDQVRHELHRQLTRVNRSALAGLRWPERPDPASAYPSALGDALEAATSAGTSATEATTEPRAPSIDLTALTNAFTTLSADDRTELGELCGLIRGNGSVTYPAAGDNAIHFDEDRRRAYDLCGSLDGEIRQALTDMADAASVLSRTPESFDRIERELATEVQLVRDQCTWDIDLSNLAFQGAVFSVTGDVVLASGQERLRRLGQMAAWVDNARSIASCWDTNAVRCATAPMQEALPSLAVIVGGQYLPAASIAEAQRELALLGEGSITWTGTNQCQQAVAYGGPRIRNRLLQLKQFEVSALTEGARVEALANRVLMLFGRYDQLQSRIANHARWRADLVRTLSDPGIPYRPLPKLDAARGHFDNALALAHAATDAHEFFSQQTFAGRGDLLAIANPSDLTTYLGTLPTEPWDGTRPNINDGQGTSVSLRDHILAIPVQGAAGKTLSVNERLALFREAVLDGSTLRGDGRRGFPFGTASFAGDYWLGNIRIEVQGRDIGDIVGALELRHYGASLAGGDNWRFATVDDTTLEIAPFFNRRSPQADDIYDNAELLGLSSHNTGWELVINQKDELVNQDINLAGLSDIVIHFSPR